MNLKIIAFSLIGVGILAGGGYAFWQREREFAIKDLRETLISTDVDTFGVEPSYARLKYLLRGFDIVEIQRLTYLFRKGEKYWTSQEVAEFKRIHKLKIGISKDTEVLDSNGQPI